MSVKSVNYDALKNNFLRGDYTQIILDKTGSSPQKKVFLVGCFLHFLHKKSSYNLRIDRTHLNLVDNFAIFVCNCF